jgi:hypothetical protein
MFIYKNEHMFLGRFYTRLVCMKTGMRKKVLGLIFSAVVITLIFSVLTPVLGCNNRTFPTGNTNCYGYGYGYCYSPHPPQYCNNYPHNWPSNDITNRWHNLFDLFCRHNNEYSHLWK